MENTRSNKLLKVLKTTLTHTWVSLLVFFFGYQIRDLMLTPGYGTPFPQVVSRQSAEVYLDSCSFLFACLLISNCGLISLRKAPMGWLARGYDSFELSISAVFVITFLVADTLAIVFIKFQGFPYSTLHLIFPALLWVSALPILANRKCSPAFWPALFALSVPIYALSGTGDTQVGNDARLFFSTTYGYCCVRLAVLFLITLNSNPFSHVSLGVCFSILAYLLLELILIV